MKNLTLKQLRKAIHIVKTSKRFNQSASIRRRMDATAFAELEQAEDFLTRESDEMPRDPREILTEIGYKL